MKKENMNESSNELSLKNEIIGIIVLFIAIFLLFSVISFTPSDPSFFNSTPDTHVENYGGKIGAQFAAIMFNLFGYSSFIILFYLLFITSFFMVNKRIKSMTTKSSGYLLLVIAFCSFISLVKPFVEISGHKGVKSGGIFGYFIGDFFRSGIKEIFASMFFLVLIFVAMILIARVSLRKILTFLLSLGKKLLALAQEFIKTQYAKYEKYKRIKKIQEKYNVVAEDPREKKKEKKEQKDEKLLQGILKDKRQIAKEPSNLPEEGSLFADFEEEFVSHARYQPPPITYLDAPTGKSKVDYDELEEKKDELMRRMNEFRIKGSIMEYTPGPVITTYEFVPDTGVKVKEVTNLSEDLALVAKAQYVRIERILGKKAIGIEIPNKKREIIHLREVLESEAYHESRSPLTIAIGKTKAGEMFVSDLREMPHLIIAGATGSGKSVAVHTILLSILFKSSPDDVKFILIDPKRVEMALYNTLPHLLTPVVVNTKLAKNALDWAVWEMEERYKKLAMLQVRSLDQYNKKIELLSQTDDDLLDNLESVEKIPYIVIVIDEFADLMMECGKDIEQGVARIAQKARAVGIHLILATQRPSTDVITGTIKNNFPSRIALAVPSKHDSRTIIDIMGAEKLLGNGDMLFLPPKTASLIRLHCAYVSEEETLRVVNYLSKTGRPQFNTQVVKTRVDEDAAISEMELDDLFFDAGAVVINTGQASASFLQRKMSIGYARAGRLIDQLQQHGVVSASTSKNKREILMSLDELSEVGQEPEEENS